MSLTKEDLQAIGELMRNEIEPLNKRMDGFDKRLDRFDEVVQSVHESQIEIEDKISKMGTQLEYLIANSDKITENEKRIDGLELKTEKHDTKIFKLENKLAAGQ